MHRQSTEQIHQAVQNRYAEKAVSNESCCQGEPGCFGEKIYDSDLSDLPAQITDGSLGCGDPVTLAGLKPGQVVLDLGSGGGLDCFLAARQVGDQGRVIGVDMTSEMIEKAHRNLARIGLGNVEFRKGQIEELIGVDMTSEMIEKAHRNLARIGLGNVEFRKGQIEELPVESGTIDVIISNCVVNLSPDKQAVLNETYRVLKPGGRLAISDLVRHGDIGRLRRSFLEAWSGCMAGTEEISDLVSKLEQAGFAQISIRTRDGANLPADGPKPRLGRIVSAQLEAVKPASR